MTNEVLLGLRTEGYLDRLLDKPPRATDNPKCVGTSPSSFLTCAHHLTLNIF